MIVPSKSQKTTGRRSTTGTFPASAGSYAHSFRAAASSGVSALAGVSPVEREFDGLAKGHRPGAAAHRVTVDPAAGVDHHVPPIVGDNAGSQAGVNSRGGAGKRRRHARHGAGETVADRLRLIVPQRDRPIAGREEHHVGAGGAHQRAKDDVVGDAVARRAPPSAPDTAGWATMGTPTSGSRASASNVPYP